MMMNWRDLPPIDEAEHDPVVERLLTSRMPSQTFLRHRDRCHRAAFLYLKHAGGPGSHELNRGSVFHLVVERLTNEIVMLGSGLASGEDRARAHELADSPAEAEEWLEEQAQGRVPPERAKQELYAVLAEHPELTVPAYERDQLRMMLTHWALGSFIRAEYVVGVEQMLQMQIGDWIVRGKLDLIEQFDPYTLDVTDYKTSWNMPDAQSWHAGGVDPVTGRARWGGDFQTQIYSLLAKYGETPDGLTLGANVERVRTFLRFPRYLREEGLAYKEAEAHTMQLTDFRVDVEQALDSLATSIATRKWQPTPGSHCGECPAEYECPLPRHLRPESQGAAIETLEDAERLGVNWYFMQRRATALKKALRDAAKRFGVDMIYVGEDEALRFIFEEREGLKPKALPLIREGIEGAVEYGHEFDLSRFVTTSQSTKWDKRKVPKRDQRPAESEDEDA